MSRLDTEQAFKQLLGVSRVLWLEHGYLAGDDTDGRIDMLARFAPDNTIVYQSCDDRQDEHFAELSAMAGELKAFRTQEGGGYWLLALPWPLARYDEDGARLPASYANFLMLYHNTAVVFETDGSIAGRYRKMHIPDDPAYYEKFYFTPGDLGFRMIPTSVGKLGAYGDHTKRFRDVK